MRRDLLRWFGRVIRGEKSRAVRIEMKVEGKPKIGSWMQLKVT